jgi:arylsulfatase A-like enzyme
MKGLEKRGLADETMVVITSDHGEEFWDHGSVGHGHSVYDELLHIPMIVRLPGVTEGKPRIPAAVGLVDVMPTILDALGQEIPEELSGRSFLPELRGETATAPRSAVAGFMTGWRTLAVGKLKLIQRTLHRPRLYDVSRDPGETQDLAESRPIAVRYARGLLGLSLADATSSGGAPRTRRARPKKQHTSEKTDIDEKTRKQLEALGYIGTSAK